MKTIITIIQVLYEYLKRLIYVIVRYVITIVNYVFQLLHILTVFIYRFLRGLALGIVRFGSWLKSYILNIFQKLSTITDSRNAGVFSSLLKVIWSALKGIYTATRELLSAIISPFVHYIRFWWNTIRKDLTPFISAVKALLKWIRESIIWKIIQKFSEAMSLIYTIRMISMAVKKAKEGDTAAAIWTVIQVVDEKLANEIEGVIAKITADMENLRYELVSVIEATQNDLAEVDIRAKYLEDTLDLMYEAFGVPLVGDLAERVQEFRRKVIHTVVDFLRSAESWVNRQFQYISEPLVQLMGWIYTQNYWFQEEKKLYEALKYSGMRDGIIGYVRVGKMKIFIPAELYRMIKGG